MIKLTRIFISFLIAFIFFSNSADAGIEKFKVEHLSLEEGISHNMIFTIHQDQKGFMWFGTMFGLIKYDGRNYTVIRHDPHNEKSISNDDITSIIEGDGCLWVGTYRGGLNRYDFDTNEFTRYDKTFFKTKRPWSGIVLSLEKDSLGNIWIGTAGSGLIKFNSHDESYQVFTQNEDDPNSIGSNYIVNLFSENDSTLWVGTISEGLYKYSYSENNFKRYKFSRQTGLSGVDSIYEIFPNGKEQLFLGTDNGVLLFDKPTGTVLKFPNKRYNRYFGRKISLLKKDREGRIWVGTQSGLFIGDKNLDLLHQFPFSQNDPNSLSSNSVVDLLEDQSGIMWVGTYEGGVDKVYYDRTKFEYYYNVPGNSNSISNNNINDITEDENSVLWFATSNGLSKFDPSINEFSNYFNDRLNRNSISGNMVKAVASDSNGCIWIGTANGLDKLDTRTNIFYHYRHIQNDPQSLTSNRISVLFLDKEKILWVGTSNGLNKFNVEKNIFERYLPPATITKYLYGESILSIYEDSFGELWVGTYRGLFRFDPVKQSFLHYKQDSANPKSISNNYVFAMYEDSDGILWIGTGGGLNKFNRATESFIYFSEEDGLPNSVISGILEDSKGNLFISTHKGISRFNPNNETFFNYDVDDGLQSNMFLPGVFFKRGNDEMVFGGVNGINIFNPEKLTKNIFKPPVYLTNVRIFDKPIKFDKALTETEEIELSYADNFLTIEFAALDYLNPSKNQYSYFLKGINREWVYNGNQNYVSFTNLLPGDYTFSVKASNSDGLWNDEILTVGLIIAPPFWRTWWFLLILGGMITATLFAIHRRNVNNEIKKTLELEKLREQENEKIRRKAANDFHDELGHRVTKISLFSEILKRNVIKTAPENLEYVDKISESVGGLSAGVRDFIWTLDPHKDTLYEVAVRLKDFGDTLFDGTKVAFRVEGLSKEFENIKLTMDWKRHLMLIFKEAMNNILKYSKCDNVKLYFKLTGKELIVRLVDDGEGFEIDKVKLGRGLHGMRNRAKSINSEVEIISNQDKGTEIKFTGKFE